MTSEVQILVLVLVAIGGAMLVYWRKRSRAAREGRGSRPGEFKQPDLAAVPASGFGAGEIAPSRADALAADKCGLQASNDSVALPLGHETSREGPEAKGASPLSKSDVMPSNAPTPPSSIEGSVPVPDTIEIADEIDARPALDMPPGVETFPTGQEEHEPPKAADIRCTVEHPSERCERRLPEASAYEELLEGDRKSTAGDTAARGLTPEASVDMAGSPLLGTEERAEDAAAPHAEVFSENRQTAVRLQELHSKPADTVVEEIVRDASSPEAPTCVECGKDDVHVADEDRGREWEVPAAASDSGEAAIEALEAETSPELPATDAPTDAVQRRRKPPRREPRKYGGLVRRLPQTSGNDRPAERSSADGSIARERALPIEVRLRIDRGGFCSVALMARRSPGLPEDVTIFQSSGQVNLRAMQDEWYQDVVPDDLPRLLRDGTVWTLDGSDGQCTWSLSGRELYVLADRPDISGYVSQPCLDLGRDHVVLCTESLRSRVEEALLATGAQLSSVLDSSLGAPRSWVVFLGVVPTKPVAPADQADILNALRPVPRIAISLERGIRIGSANWLDGYPPAIRIYGDAEHAAEVHIDGQVAECGADGAYRAPGWDSLRTHTVWCSGTSRSYSIVPFDASWELWEAYGFPVAAGESRKLTVCGPIVRAEVGEPCGAGASISVPETNPVLLGPEPGQIAMALRASSLGGVPCIASPCFRPVWALPRDPLHCDKQTIRILFVPGADTAEASKELSGGRIVSARADADRWCRLILEASRKGMKTQPDSESVRAVWLSYKRLARGIWRAQR